MKLNRIRKDITGFMKEYKTKGYVPTGNPMGRPLDEETVKRETNYEQSATRIKEWVDSLTTQELKKEIGKNLKYKTVDRHVGNWKKDVYDTSGVKFRLLIRRYKKICKKGMNDEHRQST